MLIYYTTAEGGDWNPLEVEAQEQKSLVRALDMYREDFAKYSCLPLENGSLRKVFAVLFPSSDVWDWLHRGIRQPGRPGYYEEVKELLHGQEEESQGRKAVLNGN